MNILGPFDAFGCVTILLFLPFTRIVSKDEILDTLLFLPFRSLLAFQCHGEIGVRGHRNGACL